MTDTVTAYWFAREDKQGRAYSPNKPREKWTLGQERTLKGGIVPCRYGYHASPSLWQALTYAPGPLACKVQLSGEIIPHGDDKYAASTRKLIAAVNIERELQLFAADCAEHVLYLFERERPNDDRPRKAIQAARDFVADEIGVAAWDAAKAAAGAAARAAARAAAGDEIGAAARAAAWAAAWAAAKAAAWDAAWATEQAWQREQFEQRFGHIFEVTQ